MRSITVKRHPACLISVEIGCEYTTNNWSKYCGKPSIALALDSFDEDAHWHVCEEHAKEYEKEMCYGGNCSADEDELAKRKTAYNVGYALISDDTTIRQLREYKASLAVLFATDNLAAAFELGIKNAIDGKDKLDSPRI